MTVQHKINFLENINLEYSAFVLLNQFEKDPKRDLTKKKGSK